jgi:peroxiredoxin
MKTTLSLLLSFAFFVSAAIAQKNKTPSNLILQGNIVCRHAHKILLDYRDGTGKKVTHTAYIKKGRFVFREFIESPVSAFIMSDIKIKLDNGPGISNATEIFLTPGKMKISLREDDFEHAKINGSTMQEEYNDLQNQCRLVYKVKDSLYREMFTIEAGGNTPENHTAAMKISDEIKVADRRQNQIDYSYIQLHPASYLSGYLLDNFRPELNLDSLKIYYNGFSVAVKNSIAGQSIERDINYRSLSAVGSEAPEFAGVELNGKKIDLKSFRGKSYVLLVFWSSWCKCEEGQRLRQLYAQYHDRGLEIIMISWDTGKPELKDAIKNNGTSDWHHIFTNMTKSNNNSIEGLYKIEGMPPSTLFLIDKSGKIIGRYQGTDEIGTKIIDEGSLSDLDKKLGEVLIN